MDRMILENPLSDWLIAAAILVLTAVALWGLQRFALRAFDRFARSTSTELDDLVSHVLGRTKRWLTLVVATFAASLYLTFGAEVEMVLRRVAVIAVVLQGGVWASAGITFWVDRFVERTAGEDPAAVTTVSALSFVGRLAVWSIVLLLILDNLGVEVTALLTGLGIGGIAVALAAQNILGDLFAALSIVLDKPFAIGDFLIVGDYKGTVEYIGLKTTRLRSMGGEQLVLGNSDLLTARISNLGRMSDRRGAFTIGVTYETPRRLLEAIPGWIQEIIESHEHTRFDRSHLATFGPYSIDFETVFYLTEPDYKTFMDTKQAVALAIHEKFEEEGVAFAYPTQVIYTVSAEAESR